MRLSVRLYAGPDGALNPLCGLCVKFGKRSKMGVEFYGKRSKRSPFGLFGLLAEGEKNSWVLRFRLFCLHLHEIERDLKGRMFLSGIFAQKNNSDRKCHTKIE